MNNKLDCSAPIITRGKVFQPTPMLRFVERLDPISVRVLQQKWADMNSQESEWRDVPLEEE